MININAIMLWFFKIIGVWEFGYMLKRGGDKKRAQICRRPLWVTPLPSRFQNPNLTGATRLMGPTRLTDTICKVNNTITYYIIITVHVNFGMWETQQVFSSLFWIWPARTRKQWICLISLTIINLIETIFSRQAKITDSSFWIFCLDGPFRPHFLGPFLDFQYLRGLKGRCPPYYSKK